MRRFENLKVRWTIGFFLISLVLGGVFAVGAQEIRGLDSIPYALSLLWPEEQRAFLQDGPGLLLTNHQLAEFTQLDAVGRETFMVKFLADGGDPTTSNNELLEGIRRRTAMVRQEFDTFLDDRAKLLFLRGAPSERILVDCAEVYNPLEIWTYSDFSWPAILYRARPGEPYRQWFPVDGKRPLYNSEMEYWLEQWEDLRGRIIGGKRFDLEICDLSETVDAKTGIDGLYGFLPNRPKNEEMEVFLQPPDDLAAWAAAASKTEVGSLDSLKVADVELYFPERHGQRMLAQALIQVPAENNLEPFEDGEKKEYRLRVEGMVERDGKIFERFRIRFQLPVDEESGDQPIALLVNRRLRPQQEFLLRLRLVDEISEKFILLNRGFLVPINPTAALEVPQVPEEALVALGEELSKQRISGFDSLVLIPPSEDVVFGLWRAEALVTGERIERVVFLLDEEQQMARRRPPFTAELRLSTFPKEQTVRAEGYDGSGELVAADEVIVNQPRGELRVRILEPKRGQKVGAGSVPVKAEVVVPEEMRVVAVKVFLNEELISTLDKPPWETSVEMPATGALTYLNVTAELNDGSEAEAVRFLNAPGQIDEVDVNLVELFTTVTNKNGQLARGLTADDFQVWEDERPQEIAKFELVDNLPLSLGITIDTSGSMFEALGEAQRAAVDFLENIITPRDRCFALAFADRPSLLMARTSDVGAVASRLQDLVASGSTALHDAIVTSLYYYRGIRGRRALVILSDGEDTSSSLAFSEALEYARRSGVAIYTIGLRIGKLDVSVRRKLEQLAQETGGRAFFISEAAELFEVYDEIESELRSQYLVAYNSDGQGETGDYREVKIKVKDNKLKARTIRGYYP